MKILLKIGLCSILGFWIVDICDRCDWLFIIILFFLSILMNCKIFKLSCKLVFWVRGNCCKEDFYGDKKI